RSVLGQGTVARLSFPAPPDIAPTVEEADTGSTPPMRLRLLLVDDDPVLLKALGDALRLDGHLVTIANGGQAGIDAFDAAHSGREQFSAVITDLGMPNIDGRKVAAEIKARSPTTPVILLTGWGRGLIADADIPPHVDQLLSKPPKLRDIRAALARHCHEAKLRGQAP
ncbi:MAG: response regulator, partial [Hyphomonadaceae bacterium]|nr:response regulator [Hyphomonadaceae bacterium]